MPQPAPGGIYIIRNTVNGKFYIGSAVDFGRRFRGHRNDLNSGRHRSARLQNAWKKYGAAAFMFEVLEVVSDPATLLVREQHWLDTLKATDRERGYNTYPIAGSPLGHKHTAEWKAAASKRHKGRKRPPETGARISAALKGYKHSDESRANMSGRVVSEEHRAKLREARKGFRHTAETRAKIGVSQIGRIVSAETRVKIGNARRGRKHSLETKAKMRAAHAARRMAKSA